MVRHYIRKSERGSYGEENLRKAISEVVNGNMSKAKASKQYHIPLATLVRRCKNPDHTPNGLGRYKCVFDSEFEHDLCNYIIEMQNRFYGLSLSDLRSIAFQLAERNELPHTFNKSSRMAGKF